MNDDAPLAAIERWEAHGGTVRVLIAGESHAVVELCTCYGETVETLRSSDPAVVRRLAQRDD